MGLSGRENSVDEIFVRRDVIDPAKLRTLCVASNGAGAVQTLSHLGAIAVTGTLLWLWGGTWWAVPLFAVHGVLLNFLYAGQHELSHWTVFRTGWLNQWVGRVFGFVLFYPRTFDQIQHMAHHRFTQDWVRDGELARERYTMTSYLLWMSGVTYWYTRWRRVLRFSSGVITEPYLPFNRLHELHDAIFTSRGAAPPSMTYVGFQIAVLRAFARGKTEADYPDDRTLIAHPPH